MEGAGSFGKCTPECKSPYPSLRKRGQNKPPQSPLSGGRSSSVFICVNRWLKRFSVNTLDPLQAEITDKLRNPAIADGPTPSGGSPGGPVAVFLLDFFAGFGVVAVEAGGDYLDFCEVFIGEVFVGRYDSF